MDRTKRIAGAAYQQDACGDYMVKLYEAEDYQAQKLHFEDGGSRGTLVQIRNTTGGFWSGLKKWTGLGTCATLKLEQIGDDLDISVGEGKWLDKVALAGVSMIVLWPLFFSSAVGAVKQKRLLDKVFIDALGFFSGAR